MSDLDIHTPWIEPDRWYLDPNVCFLNHGSFGACPQVILETQREIHYELERAPIRFMLQRLPHLTHEARKHLGRFLNTSPDHLVFVSNASEGVATVLDALPWRAGDEVVLSQDSYPACRHMLTELARRHQLTLKIAHTPFADEDPMTAEAGLSWDQRIYEAFKAQCTDRTRLLLIDHITSPTALVYPAHKLIGLARDVGAVSLVDGAHAPGQLALDLDALGADFYVGNLHKWVFTPKSCAFLYATPKWRSSLLPRVISHGYLADEEYRYHSLFDWVGTRDYSAMCVLPDALSWVTRHGGFKRLRARNHRLIRAARALVCARIWSTGQPQLPPHQSLGHMAAIPLPPLLAQDRPDVDEKSAVGSASSAPLHSTQRWLNSRHVEAPVIKTPHGVMLRISAQAYNALSDYQTLADQLAELQEIIDGGDQINR